MQLFRSCFPRTMFNSASFDSEDLGVNMRGALREARWAGNWPRNREADHQGRSRESLERQCH
jgi:hypothetical protein